MAKNSYTKGGYFYRKEKGGKDFLRIRKVKSKPNSGGAEAPPEGGTMADLLTPMSPEQITSMAKGMVESEFTPRRAALSQARNQIRNDLKFGTEQAGLLSGRRDEVLGAAQGQIKTAGDAAAARIGDGAKQVQDTADARNAAYQAAMKGDVRGQGLDGGYQGMLETQQKELAASNSANRAASLDASATNTQASQDLATQMRGVSQMQAQEFQRELGRKTNERLSANDLALAQLAQDESGKQSSLIEQMRKDEFTKAATIAGLDLKQQIALMQDATKRFGITTQADTTRRGQDVTMRGQDLTFKLGNRKVDVQLSEGEKNRTNAYNIALIRAAGKNKSGKSLLSQLTPEQRRKLQQGNEKTRGAMEEALKAVPTIRETLKRTNAQNKAAGKQTFDPNDANIIIKTIAKQFDLDPKLARGVWEMYGSKKTAGSGSLSADTVRYMRRMLIGIPGRWRYVGSPGAGTYDKPMG